jgi:hypothetical protein
MTAFPPITAQSLTGEGKIGLRDENKIFLANFSALSASSASKNFSLCRILTGGARSPYNVRIQAALRVFELNFSAPSAVSAVK